MFLIIILTFYYPILSVPVVVALDSKIVGGHETNIYDYPYQVALELNGINWCGGAIVGVNVVLTAAHCLINGDVVVRYGTDTMMRGGTLVNVTRVKLHPFFNPSTLDYDLGVIITDQHFKYSPTCAAVPLSSYEIYSNRTCWASGWGKSNNLYRPVQLRAADVHEISLEECELKWRRSLTNRMICFQLPDKGTCHRDTGGPLVDKIANELVGINSRNSINCQPPLSPTVYVNVAVLYDWINNEILLASKARSTASKIKLFCNPF